MLMTVLKESLAVKQSKALIRTFSVSEYRNNFILKGGMLVASIVGVDMRATIDIDTTVKALPLNEKDEL